MPLALVDVRQRHETDLDDTTLQRVLDGALEEVNRYAGDGTQQVETFLYDSARRFIDVMRPIASVTSINEWRGLLDSSAVTLAANDWRLIGKHRLLRLNSGDNASSAWGQETIVDYVPQVDAKLRESITLDLVSLALNFSGLDREKVGDWESEQRQLERRRQKVLARLTEGRSLIL